jgi:hypothetical protein
MEIKYEYGLSRYNIPCYKFISACPYCGQITIGQIHTDKEAGWETFSSFAKKKIKKCPLCNKKVFAIKEYSVFGSAYDKTADLEKLLEEQIEKYEEEECRKALAEQKGKTPEYEDKSSDSEFVKTVKGDIDEVKKYIQHLINLDFSARFLEEQIVILNAKEHLLTREKNTKIAKSEQKAAESKAELTKPLLDKIDKLEKKFDKTDWKNAVLPEEFETPVKPKMLPIIEPTIPKEPVLRTPGLFNKKKVLAENERLTEEYKVALAEYERRTEENKLNAEKNAEAHDKYTKEVRAYKKAVKEAKAKALEESMQKKEEAKAEMDIKIQKIRKQIDEIDVTAKTPKSDSATFKQLTKHKKDCLKLLEKVWDAENKYLCENVLYPNYRDIYAVTCFYEYFNSKRCYELEGPSGAYNLYEMERRSDSFATFFRKLEDISKNQVVLYRTANEMYEKLNVLDTVCKEMLGIPSGEGKNKTKLTKDSKEAASKDLSEKIENYHNSIEEQIKAALDFIK